MVCYETGLFTCSLEGDDVSFVFPRHSPQLLPWENRTGGGCGSRSPFDPALSVRVYSVCALTEPRDACETRRKRNGPSEVAAIVLASQLSRLFSSPPYRVTTSAPGTSFSCSTEETT